MKTYLLNTSATMKENDHGKWWIDRDIIGAKYINAENVNDALQKYADTVKEKHYVSISENALKNKNAMFVDSKDGSAKQIGYVITGKTSFDNDRGRWIDKYIDLWIDISIIDTPDFDEK